ncbi:MAG TPA: hypothetical protein VKB20_04940, partial [Steroidobacteraceae bacterium]|nr:hypothetical protein [Steroidobacteraceae bacterium]
MSFQQAAALTARFAAGLLAAVLLQWLDTAAGAEADVAARATLAPPPTVTPAKRLNATDLGVVVNLADPLSVAIGDYYLKLRAIPP